MRDVLSKISYELTAAHLAMSRMLQAPDEKQRSDAYIEASTKIKYARHRLSELLGVEYQRTPAAKALFAEKALKAGRASLSEITGQLSNMPEYVRDLADETYAAVDDAAAGCVVLRYEIFNELELNKNDEAK